MNIQVKPLVASLVLSFSAAAIGSVFTAANIPTWYAGLNKPWWSPPNWLFGPVWTLLYLLMALSLYFVWISPDRSPARRIGIGLFVVQIVLNTVWSIFFFGLQQPSLALVEIVILWITILLTMIYFSRVNRLSTWLLLPYLLWVSFASILNAAIFWLNR